MAAFGAQFPCFAPFKDPETATAAPTYENGVVLGNLVAANFSATFANGTTSGDDKIIEQLNELVSGAIPMETVDMLDTVAAVVYGAKIVDGAIEDKITDSPPYGGLTYFKTLVRGGKKYYKCYFYRKAQASIGNDNAQTKGTSITFQNEITNFVILPPLYDDTAWRVRETVDTIAEAQAWCREKLNMGTGAGNE